MDVYVSGASQREPPRLPVLVCLAINGYLAPQATPHLLHRVAEGGPVTYVFLGHSNAMSFLAHFNRDLVLPAIVPRPVVVLPTPLTAAARSSHASPRVRTRENVAAAAAEVRATASSRKGIGHTTKAQAMQQASEATRLREAMRRPEQVTVGKCVKP